MIGELKGIWLGVGQITRIMISKDFGIREIQEHHTNINED